MVYRRTQMRLHYQCFDSITITQNGFPDNDGSAWPLSKEQYKYHCLSIKIMISHSVFVSLSITTSSILNYET